MIPLITVMRANVGLYCHLLEARDVANQPILPFPDAGAKNQKMEAQAPIHTVETEDENSLDP
jgi:hypothetical protein